jgi:phosphoribosylanthranilate isomerase
MARITVQIYEIQNPWEAEAVIELGVNRIGSVILNAQTWKIPAIKEAILASKTARVKHSLIPLLNTKEALFKVIDYYRPHVVHFCQNLTDDKGRPMPLQAHMDLQRHVKERFPEVEMMRSVPVHTPKGPVAIPSLEIAKYFEKASDCLLTDTWVRREPVKGYIGITGQTCDWGVARSLVAFSSIPVIVAGGLSPDNVYEAVMATRPSGVDSCTGTNAGNSRGKVVRFKKDLEKVKAFVAETRRAEKDLLGLAADPQGVIND